MDIDIDDTVILSDDKEYVVASKLKIKEKIFYYIIDVTEINNYKICYEDDDLLVEVTDEELVNRLMPLFLDKLK